MNNDKNLNELRRNKHMTEKKNIYSDTEILRALANMPKDKKDLLCNTLKLGELKILACDEEQYTSYLSTAEKYANTYVAYMEALKDFHSRLSDSQTLDGWLSDVAHTYRELSTPDKVKFNSVITTSGNLETSMEILRNSWGKLMNDIIGMK